MYFQSNLACANTISKIDKQIKCMMQNNRVEFPVEEIDDFKSIEQP